MEQGSRSKTYPNKLEIKEIANAQEILKCLLVDVTKMWNGTINRMMHGMGKFHGKAVSLMWPCFTSKH